MAKTNSRNTADRQVESFVDSGVLQSIKMTATLAATDYTCPIPDAAVGMRLRAVANDAQFNVDAAVVAATTVTGNATASDLKAGGYLIANEWIERLLPSTGAARTLYVESSTAGTVIIIEFFG